MSDKKATPPWMDAFPKVKASAQRLIDSVDRDHPEDDFVRTSEEMQERDARAEEERIALLLEEAREEERGHVLTHLRNAATIARNRAADITTKGHPDDAKKYNTRAGHLGQLANDIEKGKHLPKGRRR